MPKATASAARPVIAPLIFAMSPSTVAASRLTGEASAATVKARTPVRLAMNFIAAMRTMIELL